MYRFLGAILGILLLTGLLSFSFTADADTDSIKTNQGDYLELSSELKDKTKDWNPEKVKDFKQFCWDLKRLSRGDLIVLKRNYIYTLKPQVVTYKVIKKSPSGIILKEDNNFKQQLYIMKVWPASRLIRVYDSTVSIIIRDNEARLYASRAF